jgi:hypothetical protein
MARLSRDVCNSDMEETETAAAAEALGYRSRPAIYCSNCRSCLRFLNR